MRTWHAKSCHLGNDAIKSKFQVAIPAKLRSRIGLREGDLLDATVVEDGILLRPKAVVDRQAVAEQIETLLRDASPSAKDTGRSEDEILRDVIGEVTQTQAERCRRWP